MSQHNKDNGVNTYAPNTDQDSNNDNDFYGKAQIYWSRVPATVNGMLGGLGYVSTVDIEGSTRFISDLKDLDNRIALDCGAGIGRVTKNLLIPRFQKTDLVEQNTIFAQKAHEYCTTTEEQGNRLGEIYNIGLQEFVPIEGKYDLIWCQWVLGHLTDNDLLDLFRRMRVGLANGGYLIIKENVTSSNAVEKDENDSSVTRPFKMYESMVRSCGFHVVKISRQHGFPKELYPVYMIACQMLE